ncbi:DUF2970 domain-containing protein [Glaciecola sp. 33A]|uniref:DUF2970 domain-containing protein n=1 Tax=Glaciecola sp. 33A TaxID=2057807 RepID=UPI002100BF66|nr:DUF2970 domain-containing protein [Glaciecola sp. 33A]
MLKKWFRLVKSVSASMLGVQSQKSYEEDFTEQSAVPFVVTGIVLVIVFVVSLILLVSFLV